MSKKLEEYVVTIPDFPEPGIMFRDITSVIQDPDGLKLAVDGLVGLVKDTEYDLIVGPESRGFIFGVPVAYLQGKGFAVFVTEGQAVKKGDKLMTFDIAYVKANAPSDACLCVFTDLPEGKEVVLLKAGNVKALEDAVEIS